MKRGNLLAVDEFEFIAKVNVTLPSCWTRLRCKITNDFLMVSMALGIFKLYGPVDIFKNAIFPVLFDRRYRILSANPLNLRLPLLKTNLNGLFGILQEKEKAD